MSFSMQKNKCCNLDFHQDHNIYYRAIKIALDSQRIEPNAIFSWNEDYPTLSKPSLRQLGLRELNRRSSPA